MLERKSKHIFYSKAVFPENGAICEIMGKNVQPDRPQMTM
jgi:hypothetical protein